MYALYFFLSDENRLTRYDEFLATYHQQFVEALKKFGYVKQPPSLLDLQAEMMKNGQMEPIVFLILYPLVFLDINEMKNEDFVDGFGTMQVKAFENKKFQNILKEYLERFLNKGFLGN